MLHMLESLIEMRSAIVAIMAGQSYFTKKKKNGQKPRVYGRRLEKMQQFNSTFETVRIRYNRPLC